MIGQPAWHIHIPYEFTIFNGKTQHKKWPMGIRPPFVVFFEAPSCYSARGVRGEGCGWRMLEGLGQKIFKSSPMKFSDVSTFGFEKIAWGKLRWKALWLGLGFPKNHRPGNGAGNLEEVAARKVHSSMRPEVSWVMTWVAKLSWFNDYNILQRNRCIRCQKMWQKGEATKIVIWYDSSRIAPIIIVFEHHVQRHPRWGELYHFLVPNCDNNWQATGQ